MAGWREQKREARRIVHDTMALDDSLYYSEAGATPVPVRVRLHTKFDAIGDDRSMGWAEIEAIRPRVIFLVDSPDSVKPERGGIVFVQMGEAYEIDNTLPSDDITITAEVTRMTARQYKQAALPDDSDPEPDSPEDSDPESGGEP